MKQITIVGYLGKDAQVIQKDDSFSLLLNVAVTEKYQNKEGQHVEKTDWFSCFKNFKKEPVNLLDFLKKGIKVFIQGKPTFGISNTQSGIHMNNSINVQQFDILTFPETSSN